MSSSLSQSQSQRQSVQRANSQASSTPQTSSEGQSSASTSPREVEKVLLNPSKRRQSSLEESGQQAVVRPATPLERKKTAEEPRRCWICFSDENEDTPMASAWRSPCPCALTAHEACLLDWVADMEAPTSRRSTGSASKKVLCPQCKSEIFIMRPRSVIVDLARAIEGMAGRLVLPTILMLGGTTVVFLSLTYGAVAVHMVLGHDDFNRMFMTVVDNPSQASRRFFGLSIVPWMLIFSRTSIADSILPIVPMLFFVTQPRPDPLVDFATWPPSAGLSFALLPYARAAYNAYYDYVWAEREKRWLREIKPRAGDTGEEADGADGAVDDVEFGLEIDRLGEEGEEAGRARDEERRRAQAPPLNAPPLDQRAANAQIQAVAAVGVHGEHQGQREYSISLVKLTKTVLGALAFPAISAVMGDLLRVVLPTSWTALPAASRVIGIWQAPKPTRFFQTRWARTLVGGCLFVVLKDAVTLYVRWKMAQTHHERRVLDYDKKQGKLIKP